MTKIVRLLYGVTVTLFLTSMFISIAVVFPDASKPPELEVNFLDIGQGDSILIETPDHISMLVDAGSDGRVVQRLGEVLPWWQRKIDYIVITHPDHDHYGGFQSVLQKYAVGEVLWSGDSDPAKAFKALLQEIRERNIPMRKVAEGDVFHWPSGVRFHVLWPPASYDSKDKNNRSLTGLLTFGDEDYLLTGDLPEAEESMLLARYPSLSAEVLKVGHHGSRTSSGTDFLAQVRPEHCIISAGRNNGYGHPHAEVLDRLRSVHCDTRSTIEEGTIEISTDGTLLRFSPKRFLLWESLRYGILGLFNGLSFANLYKIYAR